MESGTEVEVSEQKSKCLLEIKSDLMNSAGACVERGDPKASQWLEQEGSKCQVPFAFYPLARGRPLSRGNRNRLSFHILSGSPKKGAGEKGKKGPGRSLNQQ